MTFFLDFILLSIITMITIVAVAWAMRGLFGVSFSLPRLILAALIAIFATQPIIDGLIGSREARDALIEQQDYYRIWWIVALGTLIAFLMGMTFLVIAEALAPSNSIPGPIYMVRASNRWWRRTLRYVQIIWILLKHGVALGSIGGNRAEMRSEEGRAEMARKIRDAMSESGVTFIKLGQILSTRRDLLPPEFITEFAQLQTRAKPLPWEAIESELAANLNGKRIEDVFASVDKTPLASASIAQVHVATLQSGEEVVLKIRRPGIRRQVDQDLDILDRLAAQLERSTSWGREMGARDLAAAFAKALHEELDLSVEARNMRIIAAGQHAGDTLIPHVYSHLCTRDLLVMERMHGTPLSNVDPTRIPEGREELASTIFGSLLHQMLILGTFHADPHPGNIMLLDDGTITLLDFGSVGRIDKNMRQSLMRMLLAWQFGDPANATDALLSMMHRPEHLNEYQLERDMGSFMATYVVPGATIDSHAVADLFGIVARNGLSMPPEMAAALRAIGTIEGTLTWLAPDFNIVESARDFAEQSMRDLLRPASIKRTLEEELVALLPIITRLPRRIDRITAALEEGRLAINVSSFANKRDQHVVRSTLQELLLTILAAASGVMATMLISQDGGPTMIDGMSLFQFMGYFLLALAFILAMRVLIFIFRRPGN